MTTGRGGQSSGGGNVAQAAQQLQAANAAQSEAIIGALRSLTEQANATTQAVRQTQSRQSNHVDR